MHYQKRSRVLMSEQVHKSKQQVFVLWAVNWEAHLLASSSFHLGTADKEKLGQKDAKHWRLFHNCLM